METRTVEEDPVAVHREKVINKARVWADCMVRVEGCRDDIKRAEDELERAHNKRQAQEDGLAKIVGPGEVFHVMTKNGHLVKVTKERVEILDEGFLVER